MEYFQRVSFKSNNIPDYLNRNPTSVMEGKIDNTDVEGKFGRPDLIARDGVSARMDQKFPFHPLERSEAK